jgi:hypothetical protein
MRIQAFRNRTGIFFNRDCRRVRSPSLFPDRTLATNRPPWIRVLRNPFSPRGKMPPRCAAVQHKENNHMKPVVKALLVAGIGIGAWMARRWVMKRPEPV